MRPADFAKLLAPARARAGGGLTVLDALLESVGEPQHGPLVQWLQQEFDILALLPGHPKECRPLQGVPLADVAVSPANWLVSLPNGEQRLAMADPWDDAEMRGIVQSLGRMPGVAAMSGALLAAWQAELGPTSAAPAPSAGATDPIVSPAAAGVESAELSVIDFVGRIIEEAVVAGASDIHFECDRSGLAVKFRRDGVLRLHTRWESLQRAEQVISRIKVLAQLDITESRVPQDGRMRLGAQGQEFDLRVSIMPSVHGEDAVLRVLDRAHLRRAEGGVTLDSLGFAPQQAQLLRDLAGMPHGMLLMTGPTGSGKTTTVYAALSEINTGEEKLVTIEDPVEYELNGVLQIPVNERKGLTFARGLRSILRHDPDRILVGEIRDAETAEIAVQSALTGHLVFTTVHANSVFDVTGRFRHFGIDMYAFMSALNGVVVQRLLRGLCPACRGGRPALPAEREWLERHTGGRAQVQRVAAATGCPACGGTGYKGRFVLAEIHVMDDTFRDLVVGQAPLAALRRHIGKQGVQPLTAQAAQMIVEGRTTPEEVRRVVGWI